MISMKPFVCLMNPISFDAVNPIESPLSHIRMYIIYIYIYTNMETFFLCFFRTYFCLQEPIYVFTVSWIWWYIDQMLRMEYLPTFGSFVE